MIFLCYEVSPIIIQISRVIPSFRPHLAGKCDRESRDLTQLSGGYISRFNRLLITLDHHVRTHTKESIAQKYSMENKNIFFILYQESISDTLAIKQNTFSNELSINRILQEFLVNLASTYEVGCLSKIQQDDF